MDVVHLPFRLTVIMEVEFGNAYITQFANKAVVTSRSFGPHLRHVTRLWSVYWAMLGLHDGHRWMKMAVAQLVGYS